MSQVADIVKNTSYISLYLAKEMLKDVQPSRFARLTCPGGQEVNTNHPAFIYGHLCSSAQQLMTMLSNEAGDAACPEGYSKLFDPGAECLDDPDGTIYPSMEEVVSLFPKVHKAVLDVVMGLSDEDLVRQNPVEGRFREMCPTMGDVVIFMLDSHIMMHVGQMSAWRRCEGLGPVM